MDKTIFLGHHPLNDPTLVGTGATSNTGGFIIAGMFLLFFIGLIYWLAKKSR